VAAVPGARPSPRVVVLGLAGGLRVGQRAGDVIVAGHLELAPSEEGGAAAGPVSRRMDMPAVEGLAAALQDAGLTVSRGGIVCTSRLEHGAATRAVLGAAGALAVDMESWWLAAGLPLMAVVRVLSDVPGQELVSARTPAALVRAFRALVASARAIEAWTAVGGSEVSFRMEVQS
jgi:4-hydroxy-3-methylbut-2-enyl diphosphate reductase